MRRRLLFTLLAVATFGPPAVATEGGSTADLRQIYADWNEWQQAFDELDARVDRLAALESVPLDGPEALLAALREWEGVHRHSVEVEGYVRLRLDLDREDAEARAHQELMDGLNERWYAEAVPWLEPAILALGEQTVLTWLESHPALDRYRFHLHRRFHRAGHSLPESEERLLGLSEVLAGQTTRTRAALDGAGRLGTSIELRSGEIYAIDTTRARTMLAALGDSTDRRRAWRAWMETRGADAPAHAALLEGVVRGRRFLAEARGFDGALAAALYRDAIPPAAIVRLIETARAGVEPLRRYHRLRRRALGLERYGSADRFVPLTAALGETSFERAGELIVASAAPLGEEAQEILRRAFADGWIDSIERPRKITKSDVTFVYGEHPYVVITYDGTTTALLTLAHELGHAIHAVLAHAARPYVDARYSTLTAETVATVQELLLVEHLAEHAETPSERAAAIDLAIQNLLRNFYRTVLDSDFELAAHAPGASLGAAGLGDAYLERLRDYYGDSIALEPWDRHGWLETPHFFRAPLYMPRYGLSYAAAAALADGLTRRGAARDAIRGSYLDLLRAGGSDFPTTLLARAGADLESAETVAAVPERLDRLVTQLEAVLAKIHGWR